MSLSVGICEHLVRALTYVSLLAAAQKMYDPNGPPDQTADAYMTVVGYFNSLRELGGMRRLVEDAVRTQCLGASERRPENFDDQRWASIRALQREPVELTSRESTSRIKESRARLAQPYTDKERVDVLLASNMISVGIDIDRLGLMVVAGQPKTTSEYIQASSRAGADKKFKTAFESIKDGRSSAPRRPAVHCFDSHTQHPQVGLGTSTTTR